MIQIPSNVALPTSLISDLQKHFLFVDGSWGVVRRGDVYALIVDPLYSHQSPAQIQTQLRAVSSQLHFVAVSKPPKESRVACWIFVRYGQSPPAKPGLGRSSFGLPGLWAYWGT